MCFCLGMSESYLEDKCNAELLEWACDTGAGLQYFGFIISQKNIAECNFCDDDGVPPASIINFTA